MSERHSWFLTKSCRFQNLSKTFSGLGALLVDGKALLHHAPAIIASNYDRLTRPGIDRPASQVDNVKSLLIQLRKCGFESVILLFLNDHSDDLKSAQQTTSEVFCDDEIRKFAQTLTFKSWSSECVEWTDFIKREHISLVMTTTCDVYVESLVQFDLIYNLHQQLKLQVALFDDMQLHATYVSGFLVKDAEETPNAVISVLSNQQTTREEVSDSNRALDLSCLRSYGNQENWIKDFMLLRVDDADRRSEAIEAVSAPGKSPVKIKPPLEVKENWDDDDDDDAAGSADQVDFDEVAEILEDIEDDEEEVEDNFENECAVANEHIKKIDFVWDLRLGYKFDKPFEPRRRPMFKRKYVKKKKAVDEDRVYEDKYGDYFIDDFAVVKKPSLRQAAVKAQAWAIKPELRKRRKYCEYMERYSKSLDSSKHLHHDLEKPVPKAILGITVNRSNEKELQRDKFEIQNLLSLPRPNDKCKSQVLGLIIELFEKHGSVLNDLDALEQLKNLIGLGFSSIARHVKDNLLPRGTVRSLEKRNDNELKMLSLVNSVDLNNDISFQMRHMGDKLKRTLNSRPDRRVKFEVDEWQRELLDIVDKRESAVICCPTGGGKTFISYYAMEQSLRNNSEDVVVFVAPNKALANQVAAEIFARFNAKKYKAKKTLYAMLMPDYEINSYTDCQILVTVPNSFEGILSKKGDEAFLRKVKYIIVDEIHSLNDSESGRSIEKIIHFVQCPMLVMSATIQNLDQFYSWIKSINESKGIHTHKVVHTERFCDLQKLVYVPENEKALRRQLVPISDLFGLTRDHLDSQQINHLFHLLPHEILDLLAALEKICESESQRELVHTVQPAAFFKNSPIVSKKDVKDYEQFLMKHLREWSQKGSFSPAQLDAFFERVNSDGERAFESLSQEYGADYGKPSWVLNHITELADYLFDNEMLPAIVFLKTSDMCDQLAKRLTQEMQKRKPQKKRFSYLSHEANQEVLDAEIREHHHRRRYVSMSDVMFDAWRFGIGVHHANFHTKFRSSVEYLFRLRQLQIVFATETLSCGINMPCKTVVIPSDGMNFDVTTYRHMIGRAGRREFDTIGNIVYFGLTRQKVKSFVSSSSAPIRGFFSLDSKLLLQIACMQTYKPSAFSYLRSMIRHPISSLCLDEYDCERGRELVNIQLNLLIQRKLINAELKPTRRVKMILPLRHEISHVETIEELLYSRYFSLLQRECNYDASKFQKSIVCVLSHFVDPVLIMPSRSSPDAKNILQKVPSLERFMELRSARLNDTLSRHAAHIPAESMKLLRDTLHDGEQLVKHPKNSYIYDYYCSGDQERVSKKNDVTITKLWYAVKSYRALLVSMTNNLSLYTKEDSLKSAFEACCDTMIERLKNLGN